MIICIIVYYYIYILHQYKLKVTGHPHRTTTV